MAIVEKSIQVSVPVATAYNQWTQFEEFPKFMEGVKEVHQTDPTHLKWVAQIAGQKREWEAEITQQVPDQTIQWRSLDGTPNAGTVNFEPISGSQTKINLSMEFEPQGIVEQAGKVTGAIDTQIEEDLARFKKLIESMGVESGAWRGTV